MKELKILIEELKRDLEILSKFPTITTTNPPISLQDLKRDEIETCEKALEIFEKYKSCLVAGGLM